MYREAGKGTEERCLVTWLSTAAVNPASTRHRETKFPTCCLAMSEHIWKIMMVKVSMNSPTSPSPLCAPTTVTSQVCTGGLGWQALCPTNASCWPGDFGQDQRILGELVLDMQTAELMAHQPHSSLVPAPDFTPVRAVTSKIFPKDCTHLPAVLLEMVNYCIHKDPSKREV